jgi:glycosyltransferase involved in cell wall biosynthesis
VNPSTQHPLVSVITPVYNARRYLGEAIDSVLRQTYKPVELIVVDDASDDGSADVARSYGTAVRYAYQPRRGGGAARNRGVELARGEFLAFLDADDRFLPDKLDSQVRTLGNDGDLDMVFGHVREFLSPELSPDVGARVRAPAPHPMPFTSPTLMLIRRKSFDQVGRFSTELRVGETVDWYARAVDCGLRGLILPEVLLERRLHAQNNGLREQAARHQYARVLKASLDRRRAKLETVETEPNPGR